MTGQPALAQSQGEQSFCEQGFVDVDSNDDDGMIAAEEVSSASDQQFDELDANSDGRVTRQEYADCISGWAEAEDANTESRDKSSMKQVDSNKDGKIDQSEFMNAADRGCAARHGAVAGHKDVRDADVTPDAGGGDTEAAAQGGTGSFGDDTSTDQQQEAAATGIGSGSDSQDDETGKSMQATSGQSGSSNGSSDDPEMARSGAAQGNGGQGSASESQTGAGDDIAQGDTQNGTSEGASNTNDQAMAEGGQQPERVIILRRVIFVPANAPRNIGEMSREEVAQRAEQKFMSLDRNSDGQLDQSEWSGQQPEKETRMQNVRSRLERRFEGADSDGSGDLTREEFSGAVHPNWEDARQQAMQNDRGTERQVPVVIFRAIPMN